MLIDIRMPVNEAFDAEWDVEYKHYGISYETVRRIYLDGAREGSECVIAIFNEWDERSMHEITFQEVKDGDYTLRRML